MPLAPGSLNALAPARQSPDYETRPHCSVLGSSSGMRLLKDVTAPTSGVGAGQLSRLVDVRPVAVAVEAIITLH